MSPFGHDDQQSLERVVAVEHAAARSRALLSALREGICVFASDGTLSDASPRLCEVTGFSQDELVGSRAPYPFWPEEHVESLTEAFGAAMATKEGTFEVVLCRKDGTRFSALVDVAELGEPGEGDGILCVLRDVTPQVRERERLAKSEAALREAQLVAGIASWEWQPSDDRLLVTGASVVFTSLAAATDSTLEQVLPAVADGDRDRLRNGLHGLLHGAKSYVDRIAVELRDGTRVSLEVRARAYGADAGSVVRVRGTLQDVTEQTQAVEEAQFRARLLDEVDAAVIATDLAGVITHWNKGAERLYGNSAADTIGETVANVFGGSEADRELTEQIVRANLETGGWEGQLPARTTSGREFTAYLRNVRLDGEDGRTLGVVGVSVDVSEQVRAERELRAARDYLRAVADGTGDGLCATDTDGIITYANPAAERILGWSAGELRGRGLHATTHHHRSDGAPYPNEECPIVRSRSDGTHVTLEEDTFFRKDGSMVPVSWTSAPIELEGGLLGAVVLFRDSTERQRLQQQKAAQAAINEAARVAEESSKAKSEFLSRMSHELRTPLTAILGFGQLLEDDPLTDEQQESVEQITKAGRHLLQLINEVLDISRIESGKLSISLEPVRVDEAFVEVLDLLRPAGAQRGVDLRADLASCSAYVLADRQRLTQILLNLVSNAIKYNVRGGHVLVGTERAGSSLRLFVRDSGTGLDDDQIQRLFRPFERVGAEASEIEGTGLGLALSARLAEAMGGRIDVVSEPGVGSTFSLSLAPAEEPTMDPTASTAIAELAAGGRPPRRTVLCVEDNPANLRLLERILQRHSPVTLLTAMQGRLGIELARTHHPDVMLLDVHLPDLSGEHVLQRLRSDPATAALPVVVVSADATDAQRRRLLAAGADAYVTKPIDAALLLRTMDDLLDDGLAA